MRNLVDELIERYPILEPGRKDITEAFHILLNCFRGQGKLLIAGNGGSAADAEHIVGELMKGFVLKREIDENLKDKLRNVDYDMGNKLSRKLQLSLPAIALSNHSSLNTAFSNDVDGQLCFAQQVLGYGKEGDVFLVAKAQGMKVIGLTGRGGGRLADMADVVVAVDEKETYKVQELHLPIYHCLCLMVESEMFG